MTRCTKCGEMKPTTAEFFVRQRGGLRPDCKACCATRYRVWRKAHRERVNARGRSWRKAHPQWVRTRSKLQRELYPERYRASSRTWERAHPEARAAISAKYTARKNGATIHDFTAQQWQDMLERYEYRCAYCLRQEVKLTQDHMTPLSRGGDHTESNIVPACQSCNSKKGTKTYVEFVAVQNIETVQNEVKSNA